jgi:hypothetical protein
MHQDAIERIEAPAVEIGLAPASDRSLLAREVAERLKEELMDSESVFLVLGLGVFQEQVGQPADRRAVARVGFLLNAQDLL